MLVGNGNKELGILPPEVLCVRDNGSAHLMSGPTYLGYATSPALSSALLPRSVRPPAIAAAAFSVSADSLAT